MQSPDPNLDARLRAVPLPEGLVARLRQTALADDDGLDAALREMPLPAGFSKRLRSIPLADTAASDEEFDAALGEVPVPAGLLGKLRHIPLGDDEGLDAALRDVPIPTGLAAPWQRRLKRRQRLLQFAQLAVAASLVFALVGLYFGSRLSNWVVAKWGHNQPDEQSAPPAAVANAEFKKPADLSNSFAHVEPRQQVQPAWLAQAPEIGLSPIARQANDPRPSDRDVWLVPKDVNPFMETDLYRLNLLASQSFDRLPDPKRAVGLTPRGIDWPLAPGSNYDFYLKYRFLPFVRPVGPRLQTTVAPLGVDGASYELTRRYLEDKELPPPEVVRTEDFLASLDYDFPPPSNGRALGLSLAAGPSPLRGEGYCLLQVGVQARHLPEVEHPPVHLVLVADTSAAMRWGGRLDMVRAAFGRLARRLGPADRLSLIAFNDDARVVIQDVGPGEFDQFVEAARSLRAEGSSNVAAGLGKAYLLAGQQAANRPAVRIAILTDDGLDLSPELAQRIAQRPSEAAGHGAQLHIIDLSQQAQSDPQLTGFAAAAHAAVHHAGNADQIGWALGEVVSGQSQVVARDARLSVKFNPNVVVEYRLLGHEAKALAGLLPEHPQADFHDGQSATAVYEVRLAPRAAMWTGANQVAVAELIWYDPGSDQHPQGNQQRLVQGISPGQFASSFSRSAPSLQEAALAALAVEALRKSPFLQVPRTLAGLRLALRQVQDLTGEADSRLWRRPSFVDFMTLVGQATKATPVRRGTARRSADEK